MRCRLRWLARVLLIEFCLAAAALAAVPPGIDDATNPDIDSPALEVAGHAVPPTDVTKPAEPGIISANPLWDIPLSALAETRDRPLFTPSRRPPAPIVANVPVAAPRLPLPPPTTPEHPNLVLVGTVASETEGVAVFIDQGTRSTVRLRIGEGHLGWILQSIERRAATLQKGEQIETLELPQPTVMQTSAPGVTALPPPTPPAASRTYGTPPLPGGCTPDPPGC